MKRISALLLALLMLLAALPGLAAEYTLDEKLFKQVKDGSGLRLTLKTQKTGGAFSVLDEQANLLLSGLLPGAELSLRYLRGVGTLKGKEETELVLSLNGQALGNLHLLKDSQFEQLTSTFLGDARYVDRRDGGALLALLTGQDPAWPPVEGVLVKLNTAESTWQGNIARKLDDYLVKLTLWLQGYSRTEALRDSSNRLQNRVSIVVPAQQIKSQIKQMLRDAYNDTELMALLAQELDARQAAAYLQPGMLNSFFQALDQLPLTGSLESIRLLDANGQLIENRLVLPMGGARGLDRVVYTFTANAAGGQTAITLEHTPTNPQNQKGAVHAIQYTGGTNPQTGELAYQGTLSIQPEAGTQAFTVDEVEGDVPARVFAFNLAYTPSPEVVDQAAGSSTRQFKFSLLLTPQGDTTVAAQQITAEINLQSRLNSRSATYLTGTLSWQDVGSQALITADIAGNTAPPWAMEAVNPEGATRVDSLTAPQLASLATQLQTTLQSAIMAAAMRLVLPTTAP